MPTSNRVGPYKAVETHVHLALFITAGEGTQNRSRT
jgi:hypothetical protein